MKVRGKTGESRRHAPKVAEEARGLKKKVPALGPRAVLIPWSWQRVHGPGVRFTGVLAPVLEALTELVFPLRWSNVFIPVLPAALVDFLEAFVPYLFGTTTATLERFLDDGAVPDKVCLRAFRRFRPGRTGGAGGRECVHPCMRAGGRAHGQRVCVR